MHDPLFILKGFSVKPMKSLDLFLACLMFFFELAVLALRVL
jgi:hypothetical protein